MKFGIAILGIAGNKGDLDVLRKIEVCDEFRLFSAVAIQDVSPTYERDLWKLAKPSRNGPHSIEVSGWPVGPKAFANTPLFR